jgi:hypothetical protein
MNQLAHLDALWYSLHGFGEITEELFFLVVIHQSEQVAGLGVNVIPNSMAILVSIT